MLKSTYQRLPDAGGCLNVNVFAFSLYLPNDLLPQLQNQPRA